MHWDALHGPNQKEYMYDTKRSDRLELEFEELYYVVRKVHEHSFKEIVEPLPVCTPCFLETVQSHIDYYICCASPLCS